MWALILHTPNHLQAITSGLDGRGTCLGSNRLKTLDKHILCHEIIEIRPIIRTQYSTTLQTDPKLEGIDPKIVSPSSSILPLTGSNTIHKERLNGCQRRQIIKQFLHFGFAHATVPHCPIQLHLNPHVALAISQLDKFLLLFEPVLKVPGGSELMLH
jgi:hypothetical protein